MTAKLGKKNDKLL